MSRDSRPLFYLNFIWTWNLFDLFRSFTNRYHMFIYIIHYLSFCPMNGLKKTRCLRTWFTNPIAKCDHRPRAKCTTKQKPRVSSKNGRPLGNHQTQRCYWENQWNSLYKSHHPLHITHPHSYGFCWMFTSIWTEAGIQWQFSGMPCLMKLLRSTLWTPFAIVLAIKRHLVKPLIHHESTMT